MPGMTTPQLLWHSDIIVATTPCHQIQSCTLACNSILDVLQVYWDFGTNLLVIVEPHIQLWKFFSLIRKSKPMSGVHQDHHIIGHWRKCIKHWDYIFSGEVFIRNQQFIIIHRQNCNKTLELIGSVVQVQIGRWANIRNQGIGDHYEMQGRLLTIITCWCLNGLWWAGIQEYIIICITGM